MSLTINAETYSIFGDVHRFLRERSKGVKPLPVVLIAASVGFLVFVVMAFAAASGPAKAASPGLFGIGGSPAAPPGAGFTRYIIIIMVLALAGLAAVGGLQYLYSLDVTTQVKDIASGAPKLKLDVKQTAPKNVFTPARQEKQVFHIPENKYTYAEAKAVCKAFGGELATYDQLEAAYKRGAEWCSYGWSAGQMALFPTQKETYERLSKIKGHEHACGRPGINGGHIANPNVRFGVNCYGYKPKMTDAERKQIEQQSLYPKSLEDKYEEYRVDYYRRKLKDIVIAPFNKQSWFKI
jgi:hypothetical protein